MNRQTLVAALAAGLAASSALAQERPETIDIDRAPAAMRPMIERYLNDRTTLERSWVERADAPGGVSGRGGAVPLSPAQFGRMRRFYEDWQKAEAGVSFDTLDQAGKIDYLLLANQLKYELRQLGLREKDAAEIEPLLPMSQAIFALDAARRAMKAVKAEDAARTLNLMLRDIKAARAALEKPARPPTREAAVRATASIGRLRNVLKDWSDFYSGYDPVFTWWTAQTYKDVDQAL